ncbi:hypothetical protein BUALT_Bualt13G0088400 [Buddleja alternifolia]|uniref:Uncharacterized protein n=1 Tax=Buddleja alternifolia TaxID=168488 RepID=A0AAV6WTJ0_9LAMI|nr:hypothetical protein BUALT_Bualt13G0088400 [Buddleja alternifolia]
MASIYHGRKTLLYSDLFKCNRNTVLEREEEEEENINMTKVEGIGSSSSLSSNKSFSCDSSSVGFNSPFGSEVGSSESDDGDYMAELTRQMAECMLQEEEEEEKAISEDSEASDSLKDYKDKSCMNSCVINNLKYGINSSQVCVDDRVPLPLPPLEVYELKKQAAVRKERHMYRGKRVKGSESTHQKQVIEKREQQQQHYHNYMQYRNGRRDQWRKESSSCMQAIFLDGSKSRNGSTGTGVFLPRVTDDPVKLKKKSGCSTVLIPTRVLQALELHFNRLSDSMAPPLSAASPNRSCRKGESNGHSKLENRPANHDEEMQLPQEWTY